MTLQEHFSLKKLFLVLKNKVRDNLQISQTLENTYEGVQFSEVAGLPPAHLLRIDFFIGMKQRFQRRIHKNFPRYFNLFNKCRQLFLFK